MNNLNQIQHSTVDLIGSQENMLPIFKMSGNQLPSPLVSGSSQSVALKRNASQMMQMVNQQNQLNMLQNHMYNQQLLALLQMYNYSMPKQANRSIDSGVGSGYYDAKSENGKDNKTVFMTVSGRLSILGNRKYNISVAEINRRIGRPEMLNQSILCGILRKAKNKEGAEELMKNMAKHGINLPQGRRKNAPITTLTSFCEEEAQELVKDFKNIAEKSFPRKAIAYDILNIQKNEAEIKRKQMVFTRAQKAVNTMVDIFDMDNSPLSGQPTNRPSQLHPKVQEAFTQFSLITHGMGPAIHQESWKILSATLGECAKAFSNPKGFSEDLNLPTPSAAAEMPSIPQNLFGLFPPIPPLLPFNPPKFSRK